MKKKTLNVLLWVLTIFMVLGAFVYFPSVASIIMLLFAVIAIPLEPVRNFWSGKKLQGLTKGILLTVLFFVSVGLAPTGSETQKDLPEEQQTSQEANTRSTPAAPTTDETEQVVLPEPDQPSDAEKPSDTEQVSDAEQPSDTEKPSEPASDPEPPSKLESPPEALDGQASDPAPDQPAAPQQEPGNQTDGNSEASPAGTGNADNFHTYDNEEQQNTDSQWVLNTNTMKIHYPSCSKVKEIAPQNYSTSNLSQDELISQGYTVCKVCH